MFRFANVELLYLLILVPVLVIVYLLAVGRRRRLVARFGNPELLRELMPDFSRGRIRLKAALFIAAYMLLVIAAARPQFGSKLREEHSRGVEMMLVVDVSNSMMAEDFEPNRLERTKYAIGKLFESLQQERVGMVVFAGEPKVQLPITSDYRMAQAFAKRISPSLVSEQGTAIGRALEQAMLSFSSQSEQSRVIILITDGENHEDDAVEAARKAAEQGIRIYTIGIGTPEGAPIQIGGEFIKDENGEMVVSKLNEQMLEQIASTTGGAYVRATKQSIGLDEIVKSIDAMEKSDLATVRFEEYNEQYQYPLAAALVLLVLDVFILSRRNPRLRRFNIFREHRTEEQARGFPTGWGGDVMLRSWLNIMTRDGLPRNMNAVGSLTET